MIVLLKDLFRNEIYVKVLLFQVVCRVKAHDSR